MKANELRIGNWIYQHSVEFKVWTLDNYGEPPQINTEDEDKIKPIPLTEEWLLKFGFEKIGEYWYKGRFFIEMLFDRPNLRITINNAESAFANTVNYVHQLQNLYFALTGTELEIK